MLRISALGIWLVAVGFVPPASVAQPSMPSPAPTASSTTGSIRVDRSHVGLLPGGSIRIQVAGTTGAPSVLPSFDGVAAEFDGRKKQLVLTALKPGSGVVTITDTSGQIATVAVFVGPPAGAVPSDVTIDLAGWVTPDFAGSRIRAAIADAAALRPGSTLNLGSILPAGPLHAGDVFDENATVHISGNGTFVDVFGSTKIHVRVGDVPTLDPALLLYSDDPEYVATDGVLFRSTAPIDGAHPARVYVYHALTTPSRRLFLVLQTHGKAARVQISGYAAGPSTDYACTGHRATSTYLTTRREAFVAALSAEHPYVFPLSSRDIRPNELVAGIYDLRVVDGDPIQVTVAAGEPDTDLTALLVQPELPSDGHGRKGEFALTAVRPIKLSYAVGNAKEPSFEIGLGTAGGVIEFPNLRAGGQPLAGDFGVLRRLDLTLSNPTATPATVFAYGLAANGPVTTTLWFDGDDAPTEVPPANDPATPYLLKQFVLPPGETRKVTGVYMTDGASTFPMELGLTTIPPARLAASSGCYASATAPKVPP